MDIESILTIASGAFLLVVVAAVLIIGYRMDELSLSIACLLIVLSTLVLYIPGLREVDDAAESVETPPPAVEAAPLALDLSGFWAIAGAIGGVLLLGILGLATVLLVRRLRAGNLTQLESKSAIEADRAEAQAIWQQFVDRHSALRERMLEIETDWDMLFSYPTLVDASVASTRSLHRAMQAVNSMSPKPPAGLSLSMEISELPYPKLVTEASESWNAAWSFSQRAGMRLIPRNERKKIEQIKKLLKLAESSGSSPYEREVAYSRAEKLIRELRFVRVPERALQAIGAQQRPMIEGAGTAPATQAAEPILVGVAPHRVREKV